MSKELKEIMNEIKTFTDLIVNVIKIVQNVKSRVDVINYNLGRNMAYTLVLAYSMRIKDSNIIHHKVVQKITNDLGIKKEEAEKITREAINEILGFEVPVSEEEREVYEFLEDEDENKGEA